jgi:hypothetical protein
MASKGIRKLGIGLPLLVTEEAQMLMLDWDSWPDTVTVEAPNHVYDGVTFGTQTLTKQALAPVFGSGSLPAEPKYTLNSGDRTATLKLVFNVASNQIRWRLTCRVKSGSGEAVSKLTIPDPTAGATLYGTYTWISGAIDDTFGPWTVSV